MYILLTYDTKQLENKEICTHISDILALLFFQVM